MYMNQREINNFKELFTNPYFLDYLIGILCGISLVYLLYKAVT